MGGRLFTRAVGAVLLTASVVMIGGPALAEPPRTKTIHEHAVVETFVDVLPVCEGDTPDYTITTTTNLVMHLTRFSDGRIHATSTQTGSFVAVPVADPDDESFTGHFTVWFGFNANGSVVEGTSTFNVNGTGSEGSTFSQHSVDHFNQIPDGTVHEFFHCHDS